MTTTPENNNFFNPQNFKFILKRAPNIEFFIQEISTPDLSFPSLEVANPFVPIKNQVTHLQYSPLAITFKLDENLQNYNEIYDWINRRGFPQNPEQYRSISSRKKENGDWLDSDISIIIENSLHKAVANITLIDAHPTHLGGFHFNTTDSDINFISTAVTFEFTYLTFELL